ncbi:MAG TPA: SRPBCC family protein [Candidatus Dormibacteraeota bacterium]|nr:SRPBCC family protein [Candidatus Dormibacteraeota bacterium]
MAELPIWQLTAGFLAALLFFIGAVSLVRYPRPVMLVILGFVLLIPALGWAAYAVVPGPTPHPGPLLWLAFIPAIAGLAIGVWMLAWMSARREALTFQNIEFLSNGTLVVYASLVVALSDVLALWQPAYAVANLLASALWLLAWIPPRVRQSAVESTVEVRAPVQRVYAFLVDPSNWPRYQAGLEVVAVRPPGAVAAGSEVVLRQQYESHIRGPKLLPQVIETTSVVSEAVADRRLTMHMANRPGSTATLEFAATDGATAITSRSQTLAPYRLAVFGALIELRSQRGERRARAQQSLARLKQILEEP